MTGWKWSRTGTILFLACALGLTLGVDAFALQATRSQPVLATVTATAPIYIGPKPTPIPLRTAAVGTRLEVLDDQGEWVQVRFGDPVLGPRVGWVQSTLIRIERPELQPMDLSIPPPTMATPPREAPAAGAVRDEDDDVGAPTSGFGRSGLLVGFSVGPGFLTCGECDWTPGFGLDFHIGGMVSESVGLMYDNVATVVELDDSIWSLDTMTVAVQGFAGRGWVKAGAGFGVISCGDCFSFPAAEAGWALMGGAGAEFAQRGRFAMDLQGRFTFNQFDSGRLYTVMATVGFNWY
jgi:hypothetical protein